jgi:hypothetical protein
VTSYIDDSPAVNGPAGEIEFPAFLPRRPLRAPSCKPRRRLTSEAWGRINAAVARERQSLLALCPDSPRVRPTLAHLHWLERAIEAA